MVAFTSFNSFAADAAAREIPSCYFGQMTSSLGVQSADQVLVGCILKYVVDANDLPIINAQEDEAQGQGINPLVDPVGERGTLEL